MAHKDNAAVKQTAPDLHSRVRELIDGKNYAAARDLLLQSLRTEKTAALYCDLGEVHSYMGNKNEAVINFETAIKLDPQFHKAYACIAELLLTEGHIFHAIDYYALAIKAAPDDRRYITIFLTLARQLQLKAFNKDLKELLTGILKRDDVSISHAAKAWLELLWKDPSFKDFKKILKNDGDGLYDLFKKTVRTGKKGLLDPYFLLGIKSMVIPSRDFENLLTCLRRFLLESFGGEDSLFSQEEYIQIASALSCNCLLTEYVFNQSDDEDKKISALRSKLEDQYSGDGSLDESLPAILACYMHVSTLKNAKTILSSLEKSPNPVMRDFASIHINDILEQKKIKETIATITKITDSVSVRVREQYEEFPYPRWTGFNPLLSGSDEADAHLKDKPIAILNAGCGTGQEAVGLATVFPQAKILAVDLSLTSIAYGAKRARDLGIQNIDFRQGDILALGSLDQKFDYIASGGVLHHLEDPAKGLAVLTGLLKPDGIMRLGLYSETARRFIVEARKVIKDRGFQSDSDNIRNFRHQARSILNSETFNSLCSYRDYFTLSECRDLLFHVQEHRFTISTLKEFLARQNLEFIKFYIDPAITEKYKKSFPQDKECTNLDNWAAFEEENPDTFIEMYKFWCRKKPL